MKYKLDLTIGRYRLVLDMSIGTLVGVNQYPVEDLEVQTNNVLMKILINKHNPYPWKLI